MADREPTGFSADVSPPRLVTCIRGVARLAVLGAALALTAAIHAAETDEVGPSGDIGQVRRIFVPADRPDVWPTHGETFLPVDPDELDELIGQAHASDRKSETAQQHAVEAVYYARYIVNRLIDGQGCIVVASLSERPLLLDWPTSGAMIRNPRWKDRESEPVKLGTWGANDSLAERPALLVNQSGSLLFSFQTSASAESDDSTQFGVASPRALRRRLYLDLPEPYELASEEGSVALLTEPVPAVTGRHGPLMELPPLGIGYRRWRIASGPGGTMNFRVKQSQRSTAVRNEGTPYREQLTYSLQPEGMVLTATFQFLEGHRLPPELTVELDPSLKLVGAQWQGAAINWQEQAIGATGDPRVRIAIPDAHDRQPLLRIEAWKTLPAGDLSRLPQASLPDLFWTEGTLEIDVAQELKLLDLQVTGLSPIAVSPPSQLKSPRSWQFTKLRPQASAEVALQDANDRTDATIGTSLELSSASTKAVIRMQLRASGRSLPPRLEAEVLGGWVIDSVESSSAIGFTDWYVDQSDGRRMLRVQFREPGDATYPGEVAIEAHLPKSVAVESLSLAELMPVDWQSLQPQRHILAVTVIEPFDLRIEGNVDRLSLDDLTERDWELLQNPDVAAVMLMKQADRRARLQLLPQRPMFEAQAEIAVLVDRKVVRQEAAVQISPLRNPLSKLRVLLSPGPAGEVNWIDPETGAQLPAARLAVPIQDSSRSEMWEVQLSRGHQALVARWSHRLREKLTIPLLTLPEAAKQTATVRVSGIIPDNFDVIPTGLVQHPLATALPSGKPVPDAVFRYDPAELARDSAACQLVLNPSPRGEARSQTVVERVRVDTQFALHGESSHRAEFVLNGACPIRCWMPDDARQVRVAWDGQIVAHSLQANELRLNILPAPAASTGILRIDFTLPQQPLRDGTSLEIPLPNLGLPLPAGRWAVQLPNSFQLATPEYLASIEPGWRGRLFGPWARKVPVSETVNASGASAFTAGWKTWEFQFAGSLPNPVRVIELNQRWAFACGIGLAVGCLTAWQIPRRPRLLGVLLGIAGIAALWLPPISSLFATAAWLGMLFGVVWAAVSAAIAWRREAKSGGFSKRAFLPATAAPLIALVFFASPRIYAQGISGDGNAASRTEASKSVEVLIPVDSSGTPATELYLVPAPFLEELLRASQRNRAERGGDWVIHRGRYQGELRQDDAGEEALVSIWNLSWELDVQRRNATVRLPLVKNQGAWQSDASVDGIPVPLRWSSDGQGCEVLIREPGPHLVTVRVEPQVRTDGEHATLQLALPPVLDAELQLVYPNGLKELELPDSIIPTAADSQRSKVVFALPDSRHLELGWELNAKKSAAVVSWEVEQRELLSISPNGAELEVRLVLRGSGTSPAEVRLAVDGLLERLDTQASAPAKALSDARNVVTVPVTIQLAPANTEQATATSSFRLPRDQVFGNYRFPQVQVLDLVTRSKVAAVSLSDRFSYETIQSPIGETMETTDFGELWGDPPATCVAAYRILAEQTPWTMAIQPRVTPLPPEESLLVSCGLDEMEVEYQAQFDAGGAPLAQQALQVPPQLRVRSVTLERSTQSEPLVWTRPTPDRVVAFFPQPLSGDFRLILSSVVERRPGDLSRIPAVTARPGENLLQQVQIYRRPDCLVQIRGPQRDRTNSEFAGFNPWGTEAYLVEAFRFRPDQTAELSLDVQKNPALSTAQSLTVFDPAVGVAFVSQIRVTQGILDRVNLETPADWIGPLDITPAAQVVEQGDAAPGRRQVQIQLTSPVPAGQQVELRFNGSIAAPKDGSWIVPVLRLLGPNADATFVVVPGDEPSAVNSWTLQGAVPADLPPAIVQGHKLPPRARAFRVFPPRAEFVIRRSPAGREHAAVEQALADVFVREDASGSQVFTTRFLLPPIASRELVLQWPEAHQPIAVYLENRLLASLPIDGHRWRLPIGPTDLPVALTAVSKSVEHASHNVKWYRPRLWDEQVEYAFPVTLWSVATPLARRLPAGSTTSVASGAEIALLRLARLTQLVAAAESRIADLSPADRGAWTRLWTARLRTENAKLERAESLGDLQADESIIRDDEPATQQQLMIVVNQLLGRLVEPEETTNLATIPNDAGSEPSLPDATRTDGDQESNFIVGGPQSSLDLQSTSTAPATKLPHAAITIFLVAAVGILLRRVPSTDLLQSLAHHPRWLIAALGLVSWLLLELPAVGFALLLAALLSWAGDRWLRRTLTDDFIVSASNARDTKR